MKAGIYLGQEQIELRELPLPEVGDRDVLVQNLYSSVCGTDVAVFFHGPNTGHKVTVGGEFGHETVSRVVKVGKDVTDFTVGERVYPIRATPKAIQSVPGPSAAFRNTFSSPTPDETTLCMRWMTAFPTDLPA